MMVLPEPRICAAWLLMTHAKCVRYSATHTIGNDICVGWIGIIAIWPTCLLEMMRNWISRSTYFLFVGMENQFLASVWVKSSFVLRMCPDQFPLVVWSPTNQLDYSGWLIWTMIARPSNSCEIFWEIFWDIMVLNCVPELENCVCWSVVCSLDVLNNSHWMCDRQQINWILILWVTTLNNDCSTELSLWDILGDILGILCFWIVFLNSRTVCIGQWVVLWMCPINSLWMCDRQRINCIMILWATTLNNDCSTEQLL